MSILKTPVVLKRGSETVSTTVPAVVTEYKAAGYKVVKPSGKKSTGGAAPVKPSGKK